VNSYNPRLHQYQTTKLTLNLIDIVLRFFNESTFKINIPFNYFKTHQHSVDLMKSFGLVVLKNSIELFNDSFQKIILSNDFLIMNDQYKSLN
jgi:hypothetical protein